MKPKLKFTIVKEEIGYSAFAQSGNYSIHTEGDDFETLKKNIIEAVTLTFEPDGHTYTMDEIIFAHDLESFFDFYRVINVSSLAQRIGMNQSLLAQYIKGNKKPSRNQIKRIISGVQQIGHELIEVDIH